MNRTMLLLAAVALACTAEGPSPVQLSNRGSEFYAVGQFAEAEAMYRKALDAWTPNLEHAAQVRAVTIGNLGATLRALGRFSEAEPLLLESLKQLESLEGAAGSDVAHTVISLAALYRAQGNFARAEVFALRGATIGTAHDKADARLTLASVYVDERRYDEAEPMLTGALNGAQGTLAAVLYNNLSSAAIGRAEYARAETFARNAQAAAARSLPRTHPVNAAILNNLAQACRFQGKYVEAEANYHEAIAIWETALGPLHPDLARGLLNLASFYHQRARDAAAEKLYRRAAAIFARTLGENRLETVAARHELAGVLRAEHRLTEANQLQ